MPPFGRQKLMPRTNVSGRPNCVILASEMFFRCAMVQGTALLQQRELAELIINIKGFN